MQEFLSMLDDAVVSFLFFTITFSHIARNVFKRFSMPFHVFFIEEIEFNQKSIGVKTNISGRNTVIRSVTKTTISGILHKA